MLSDVSNYGSALGQTPFLQIIIEGIKVGDTEVSRPPYWLWLNQMLSGLKQEDVFSVLVNLAIDCLEQRVFKTLTPSNISGSIPETRRGPQS